MFGIVFRIEARPGKYQELLEFLKWDGEVCRDREPGTLRFEFLSRSQRRQCVLCLRSLSRSRCIEAHKKNEPFQRWSSGLRDTLGTNFTVVFREDAVWSPAG